MPSKNLTDAFLRTAKVPAGTTAQIIYWDSRTPGFGLRVSPGTTNRDGARAWVVMGRKRSAGRWVPTRVTLGRYPEIPLADARRRASDLIAKLKAGETPQEIKAAAESVVDERHKLTIKSVGADFIAHQKRIGRRTWEQTESQLERDVYPAWEGRSIADITKRDIRKVLEVILNRGSPYAANRMLANIKRLFAWAVSAGVLDSSPALGIEKPSKEETRDRVLADAEVVLLWAAAARLSWPFEGFLQILLLTAQRRGELAAARWEDIEFTGDKPTWTIAAKAAKNGRAHVVPLVPAVVAILKAQPGYAPDAKGYVFTTTKLTPISGFGKAQRRLNALINEAAQAPMANWRLHDLRRTAASGMAELGVAPHVVEAVLNHKSGVVSGVAAVYNRFAYAPEMRAALTLWADRVGQVVLEAPADINLS